MMSAVNPLVLPLASANQEPNQPKPKPPKPPSFAHPGPPSVNLI